MARDEDARRDPRTSEAPTLDRRGLLVGAAASCASAPLAARADTEDIAKAYDGYAATYDDLDGGAFAAETSAWRSPAAISRPARRATCSNWASGRA